MECCGWSTCLYSLTHLICWEHLMLVSEKHRPLWTEDNVPNSSVFSPLGSAVYLLDLPDLQFESREDIVSSTEGTQSMIFWLKVRKIRS